MRGGIAALEEVAKSTSTAAELASLVLMRAALKTYEADSLYSRWRDARVRLVYRRVALLLQSAVDSPFVTCDGGGGSDSCDCDARGAWRLC